MDDGLLSEFLHACGATGPLELCVEAAGTELPIVLGRPFAIIGRTPNADIVVDETEAGWKHAYMQLLGGHLLCVDIQGLYRPSRRPRCAWVAPGRALRIGETKVRLVRGAPDDTELLDRRQLPTVVLTDDDGKTWKIRRPLTLIGSCTTCKVQMVGPGVSRIHAALVSIPRGVWLVDLLGRGGIASNDVAGPAVPCRHGDRLRVGQSFLDVRVLAPGESASTSNLKMIAPPRSQRLSALATAAEVPELMAESLRAQEMIDRHREQTAIVFRALIEMQREQTRMLRDEMERMDQLSKELAELRAEQVRLARSRPSLPAPAPRPNIHLPQGPPTRATNGSAEPSAAQPVDVHAWLDQRVAELQQDRHGAWRRVRSFFGGAPADADPPASDS
ncbi:MAG: hypothetical protein U0746_16585 [Gemmataceae bacterium]